MNYFVFALNLCFCSFFAEIVRAFIIELMNKFVLLEEFRLWTRLWEEFAQALTFLVLPVGYNEFVCLFCSIFILLSQENAGGAILWTNLHPLRSCQFPWFPVCFFFTSCTLKEKIF